MYDFICLFICVFVEAEETCMKVMVDIILLVFHHPFLYTGEKDQEQGSISLQHLTAMDHKTMII